MEKNVERARNMLPSIIITVLSMIQALALELYWTRLQASEFLWQIGWDALLGWLQLAVMLLGIIQIWLMYVSLVLRFSWLPSITDTVIPFAIGLLEFWLIDLMGPGSLATWFMALALLFGVSMGAAHTAHRQARNDPENDYFFAKVAPTSWKDYVGSALAILLIALFGVALQITGNRDFLAVVALFFAAAALVYQLMLSRHYWMHSLTGAPDGARDSSETGK